MYAYELLFRSGTENHAGQFDGGQATSQVIANALIDMGLDHIIGPHRAFINLTRSFLTGTTARPFPEDRVVLEVLEGVQPDAEVIEDVRKLAEEGYVIAIDDLVFSAKLGPLLALARIIKLDLRAQPREMVAEHMRLLRGYPVKLLAEKVERQDDFAYSKTLGFDLLARLLFVQAEHCPGQSPSAQSPRGFATVVQAPGPRDRRQRHRRLGDAGCRAQPQTAS